MIGQISARTGSEPAPNKLA